METVLFIILPYPSHYNACFGLAHVLKKQGKSIIFTGFPHHRKHVEQQGYEFIDLYYTTEYKIKNLKGFLGLFLNTLLNKRHLKNRYRMWYQSVIEIRHICRQYKPTQIFIDAHLSHYYLYLYTYRQLITILSTKLSAQKTTGLPPLNSFYIPVRGLMSKFYTEFLWFRYTTAAEYERWKNKAACLGKDEIYFQKRLCKKHLLKWQDVFEKQNTSFIGLKKVPTLILGTEALEFPQRKILPHERYLFLPISRNEAAYISEEYQQIKVMIKASKTQPNRNVIYCSFGTLESIHHKQVSAFINKLIRAVETMKNIILVISTANQNLNLRSASSHIFILKRVPQLDMLKHSDMMITHGGHNSIKECLQAGVPMLVYPLNQKVDQPGNAVRVMVKGYGLMGRIDKDSSEVILCKIRQVLHMRYTIQKMEHIKKSPAVDLTI